MTCVACALEVPPSLLACPSCHTLLHADRLRALAASAEEASARGDVGAALSAWREAALLLPPASQQFATVRSRIEALSSHALEVGTPESSGRRLWSAGALTGAALLAWKFKAVVFLVLSKAKLLALGLTNSTTLFSMVPAIGVYWVAFGWKFAAGLVASIYVHEMGHVAALRRFGIAASAPMFIPGLGAVIRSRHVLTTPHENARVGLAGPIWGLGAALASWVAWRVTAAPIWAAIAQFGALVNLFNLMPVWQLDGAHAFTALTRTQRWLVVAVIAAMFAVTREGLLLLVGAFAVARAWHPDDAAPGDAAVCAQMAGLVVILSLVGTLPVPDGAR